MKTQKMKMLFGLFLCAAMVFQMTACKSGKTESDSGLSTPELSSNISSDDASSEQNNSNTSLPSSSQNSNQQTTSSTPNSQSAKKTNLTRDQVMANMPAKLKNTTIKYMTWDNPRETMEKNAIAEFEKKTGIKVQIEMVALGEKHKVLASRIAAGKSPDVFRTDEVLPFVCKNLQPIQNLNYNFNDKAWDWDLMNYATYNGRTYSMQLADTPFTPVAVLFYNKAALKKAEMDNMDPYTIWKNNPNDWTWDKFFAVCDTFLSRNGNRDGYYGCLCPQTYIYAYMRCFGLANMDYNPASGKFVSNVKTPEYVKHMEILSNAMQKKYISPTASGFEMGNTLFCWDWGINAQPNIYFEQLKKRNNLGIVPIPTDSTKQVLYQHIAHGVPVGAKNGEAVPYFIRYIQDRNGYNIETIYSVPNSAEVIEWSIQRGRQNKSFFVGGGVHNYGFITEIQQSAPNQVKAICDKYAPEFEAEAKKYNEEAKNLPK